MRSSLKLCLLGSFILFLCFFGSSQVIQNTSGQLSAVLSNDLEHLRTTNGQIQDYHFELEINQEIKKFKAYSNNLLSEQLKSEYPNIRSYDLISISDPGKKGKMTLDHAQTFIVFETKEGLYNITSASNSDAFTIQKGISTGHECESSDDISHQDAHMKTMLNQRTPDNLSFGGELRTYDLVVVGTGEFTDLNGGAIPAMTVLTNTVNALNLMYEKDLAVHLNLFDTQLYPNENTDPFTPDNNGGDSRTNQAAEVCAMNWTNAEYDIGHVFHRSSGGDNWSGGGVAGLGVVCSNGTFFTSGDSDSDTGPAKAAAWSGSGNNTSNGWYQLAAHEFGHQFNAPHSFNGSGGSCSSNISASNSYEIGSGTTIMSYQGICSGAQNIPGSGASDNYFHSTSIDRMNTYVSNSSGDCSDNTPSGNTPPVVNANPDGGSYLIPGGTPFELVGTATDANGDEMTFNWEQIDEDGAGTPTQGFTGSTAGASPIAPLFRSYPPSDTPKRIFPELSNILAGTNTGVTFEALPTVDRTMNFAFLARDNNVNAGGVSSDGISIEVDGDSGPFEITSHNSGSINWFANGVTTVTITWDVAGTDIAPMSCANVDLLFSTDNGENFNFILASSVVNDGSHEVIIPNLTSSEGRIKIKCSDNIFFDINNVPIDIATGCGAQANTFSPTDDITEDAGSPALNLSISSDNTPAPGHSHTFVIVDNATGNIQEISSTADLSDPVDYPEGVFTVYGMEYENGEDFSPYIGGAFSSLQSDALSQEVCANISSNSITVTIIFIGCQDPCFSENGSAFACSTFIDTDNDGVCDANDGCPNDPNKSDPGQCGCGNLDTDSDSDGEADCVDPCPNDPLNFCGPCIDECYAEFGSANSCTTFIDADSDGTCDVDDACPNDPNKIAPGQCGCGNSDVDTDNDGTSDCNDNCPNDPNKVNPGTCGCGFVEAAISADAGPDQGQCDNDTFDLNGNIPSAGTTLWTVISGDGSISNSAATSTTIVGVTAGQITVVEYSISNGNCFSSDQVILDNSEAVIADAGPDQNKCTESNFTLSANTPAIGTGFWTLIFGTAALADANDPNSPVSGISEDASATFTWTVFNGNCIEVDTVILSNFSDVTDVADAGPAQLVQCENSNFNLTGNSPTNPSYTILWEESFGIGNFLNGAVNQETVTYENLLVNNAAIVIYNIQNGACETSDQIILFNAEFIPSDAGPNQNQCSNIFTMNATPPSQGTGLWTVESGSVLIDNASSPTTEVTITSGTTASLKWTVTNEACEDESSVLLISGDCGTDCNDPCYAENGTNSPCSTFLDADNDGTCDANDGCPNDPNKITPGTCGCGIADSDTDSDGTADCNDGCPNDPNKIAPGVCGCGVADTDTDSDGTADCNDGCPNDPNKIAPAVCGCGIADTDTDSDGTADCDDGCPIDPNKIAPGACGCGVADTDTDSDGTADCNDACPNDPNKIAPGVCGCGIADTDTDSDGTADCNDACPNDSNKISPGICGCGIADTDTDSDGTADCNDACPNDPNKIAPGDCGCGNVDEDLDNDSISDCIDPCPGDPTNTCNNCNDPCFEENGTIFPCLTFLDSDNDGTCDANDGCPNDPNKIAPGDCGCGVSDIDTDSDGTADCIDGCPNDPNKIAPGDCGCGVSDIDTDSDGTADCNDGCPNDPNKIAPGTCGCGVADGDNNGNGVDDCLEDPTACEAYNFVFAPTGLFEDQAYAGGTKTRLNWTHYSDATTACIVKGGTIGALDVSEEYTQSPGQVLIQGPPVSGIGGLNYSAQLLPNSSFQLFVASQYPDGPIGSMVPDAFYKWQVQCGCLINPTLPLPERLEPSNVHISPWSEFDLFTNLSLNAANENNLINENEDLNNSHSKIYPNPFSNELTFEIDNEGINSGIIEIRNTLGELIMSKTLSIQKGMNYFTFNTQGFERGIFFINIVTQEKIVSHKVVKY